MSSLGRPRSHVALAIFVAVAGVIVFIPSLTGGWIYDDHPLIQHNAYVHSFAAWPRWFVTDFWNVDDELVRFGSRILYWRPAVDASYALDWKLGGGAPLAFHITNSLLQAATSLLAFVTLRRWLGTLLPAFAAALLFVVHPTKAESVAWIAGRTDIVCLLAVLVASLGIARRLSGKHGGIALEAAGTLVAYLSKEQAIVLPCFAAVEAWVAAGRPALDRGVVLRAVRGALPQAALAVAYLAIRAAVLPIGPEGGSGHVPLGDHALAVLETLGRFAALAFAPHELSIQQGLVHAVHGHIVHSAGYVVLGGLTTLALAGALWWTRRRAPVIAVGIALYFVTLLPTSNVIYTSMSTLISERFLFLPLFGLALAAGGVLELAERRWGRRVYAIPALAAVALSAVSLGRAADYRDEDAFWARELRLHPDSFEARNAAFKHDSEEHHYYSALAILQHDQAFDYTVAQHLERTNNIVTLLARLLPDHAHAELEQLDRFLRDVLDKQPARVDLLGVTYAFDVSRLTKNTQLERDRPRLLAQRADLQSRLGHDAGAVELARQAVEICPTCISFVNLYALELARAGRYDDALAVLGAHAGTPPDRLGGETAQIEAAHTLYVQGQALQGPAALQARASELAKLELWGRAFDVLAPYEADIARVPNFALGFAELAFRAGETAAARRVLSGSRSPAEIDTLIAGWTDKMGWTR